MGLQSNTRGITVTEHDYGRFMITANLSNRGYHDSSAVINVILTSEQTSLPHDLSDLYILFV